MTATERIDAYRFRGLVPHARFGTASDRYAAWVGQIYDEAYAAQATTRPKRLGGRSFTETVLPVESVAEYFEHFDVLEIDYTFYSPLLQEDGRPSRTLHTLTAHTGHAPDDARFLLKAPEAATAARVRRGKAFVDNPTYLDPAAYLDRFLRPAADRLGDRLGGVIFEQGYLRKADAPAPADHVRQLARFFDAVHEAVPPDLVPHHVETRSSHLLGPDLATWAATERVGLVLSHWTWLPPLARQWDLAGAYPSAADRAVVVRLLTPRNVKYADAYAATHPFDQTVAEVADTPGAQAMVDDVVGLLQDASRHDATLDVLANNRAWGNAPNLVQAIARRATEPAS